MTPVSKRLSASLLGLLLIPVLVSAEPAPESEAHAWLDKMSKAMQRLNYDGIFIYRHDEQIETVRIVHQSGPQGERERLVSLTGAAREIIQDGDQLTCYLPHQKSVMVGKSHPRKPYLADFPDDLSRLGKDYRIALAQPPERMAGFDTRIVTITPRDAYRYGYRLWLEKETGMPLKSDLLDEQGAAVEQVMFTSIRFLQDVPPELLQPTLNSAGFAWHRDTDQNVETPAGKARWRVTRLPDGFMLTHHSRHTLPDSQGMVEHMVFSDALASLSVYIEQAGDAKKMLNGMSRMGAVNAYGAVVDGHHVTVVGEVPGATVRLVGESIRAEPDPVAP